jgi:hypothetical protein
MRFYFLLTLKCGEVLTVLLSVSEDLLCAFELLKPLDGPALRKEMTKAKRKRCDQTSSDEYDAY